ncbi:hypothetical protein HII17_09495 [Thalassotalea sp. M1531]|uniref:Cxxc_20_cxxc protein n=1 Tax=Thalassotalea algicola TaxID=2716224 RepID=A0A7Y0LCW9_9GAMM|nr:hypothetical protein [Thalassotalea algicola]NMP31797.1 hypothetical protein [Thalassotalea algicola]
MKAGICPHCEKKIPNKSLRNLQNNRAIYCPFCAKPIRINQKSIILTVAIFSGIAGIIGKDLFNVSLMTGLLIVVSFAILFSLIYLRFIGIYFPLECAENEDLYL